MMSTDILKRGRAQVSKQTRGCWLLKKCRAVHCGTGRVGPEVSCPGNRQASRPRTVWCTVHVGLPTVRLAETLRSSVALDVWLSRKDVDHSARSPSFQLLVCLCQRQTNNHPSG